jgi:excisionase family DNA binding protein
MASNPRAQVERPKGDDLLQGSRAKKTTTRDRFSPDLAIVAPKQKKHASRYEALSTNEKACRESVCRDGLLKLHPDSSRFLGVSRSAIFQLLREGQLPYVRVTRGGDRRIPRQALVEFAASRLVEQAP